MIPIQSVSIGDSCYFSGSALSCLLDQMVAAFGGEQLFGLVLGALLFGVFYIAANNTLATPTVVTLLTGTVIVPMLTGQFSRLAMSVVVIGAAAALWGVLKQYVLSGAANT